MAVAMPSRQKTRAQGVNGKLLAHGKTAVRARAGDVTGTPYRGAFWPPGGGDDMAGFSDRQTDRTTDAVTAPWRDTGHCVSRWKRLLGVPDDRPVGAQCAGVEEGRADDPPSGW